MRLPSIKYSGPLLFLVPVLAAVVAYSLIAAWQGRRLADEMAEKVMNQAAARVTQNINDYLQNAILVTDYSALLIEENELSTTDIRNWRADMYRLLIANQEINSVTFGNVAGDATWMIRYPNEPGLEYAIRDAQTDGQIIEYAVDTTGELGEPLGSYDYDPRIRPWYQAAATANKPTWSDIYAWVRRDSGNSTLGIAYARPIVNEQKELLGVLDSDVSLVDVSRFLRDAQTFSHAQSMLVSEDGRLIATSSDVDVIDDAGERIVAAEAENPLLATVSRTIGSFAEIQSPVELDVISEGEEYRVDVRPFENPWNLNWRIAVLVPDEEIMSGVHQMQRQGWWVGGAIALVALGLGLVAARSLIRPITKLADSVRRIGGGEFDKPVNIGGHAEFSQLSHELNRMAAGLKDRLRLRQSLELAMEIQQKLLPGDPPHVPGLDVAGRSTYCDETGGDYYDFIEVKETDSHQLVVALGDVMGHGIAAALLMATARGILRSRAEEESSLGRWLTHLNRLLVEDTGGDRFMTMILMIVDPDSQEVRFAIAGHDPPILYDPDSDKFVDLPDIGGLPLGLIESEEYQESLWSDCQPGQILLVGTDGLWESQDINGDLFGKDRLCAVIRRHKDESADEISAAISRDLRLFRGQAKQDDDITCVLVKFTGEEIETTSQSN